MLADRHAPHRLRRLVDGRSSSASSSALYDAFAPGRPSPLPELPIQYADYAALAAASGSRARCWSSSWRTGGSSSAGAPRRWSCRPTGRGPPCRATAAASGSRVMPPATHDGARGARPARGRDAVHDAAGGVPGCCLHRYTGQDDIVRRLADRRPHARARPEGLIGFFVNTLVLRTDLVGRPDLPRAAGAGARGGARRLRPPGRAVRAAGRGAAAGAQT